MRIIPPVSPFSGLRTIDAHGGGGFGAPRGRRTHGGLDFLARAGQTVVSPIGGRISRLGIAYLDNPDTIKDESTLKSFHIRGRGPHQGIWIKLLYVLPFTHLREGEGVTLGQCIGHAQDRASFVTDTDLGPMSNHIHEEVRIWDDEIGNWVRIDPANLTEFPDARQA